MDCVKKFGYGLAFDAIVYSIENKKIDFNRNPIFMIYVDKAKEFFSNTIKGLESIIKRKDYFFVEDLREIVEIVGDKRSDYSKEYLQSIIGQIKNKIGHLDILKENSQKFYESKDAQDLLIFCEEIKNLPALT